MKNRLLYASLASSLLVSAGFTLAQSSDQRSPTYNAGGSAHCESMTGAARLQCLNDEGAKTEKGIGTPSSSGASDMPRDNPRYGESGSPRCGSMSGAGEGQGHPHEQTQRERKR